MSGDRPEAGEGRGSAAPPTPDGLRRKALVLDASLERSRAEAIAGAEAALSSLSGEFAGWIRDEVSRLSGAHARFAAAPDAAGKEGFFKAAHDIRGHAASLGYPLTGRMAGSLATLLSDCPDPPSDLLAGHVEAIRASVRETGRDPRSRTALELTAELERQAERAIERRRPG